MIFSKFDESKPSSQVLISFDRNLGLKVIKYYIHAHPTSAWIHFLDSAQCDGLLKHFQVSNRVLQYKGSFFITLESKVWVHCKLVRLLKEG